MAEPDPTPLALRTLFDEHAAPPASPSAARSFRTNGRTAIAHLERMLGREPSTCDLSQENLQALAEYLVSNGRKASTAERVLESLLGICRTAHRVGLAVEMERVQVLGAREHQRRAARPDQVERLLAACLNVRTPVAGTNGATWWLAFLTTLINVDGTVKQLLALTEHDWHGGGQYLTVSGKRQLLHALTQDALARLQLQPSKHVTDRLFPWDLCEDSFYNHFEALTLEAGLTAPRQTPATLRLASRKYGARVLLDLVSMPRLSALAAEMAAAEAQRRSEARQAQQVEKIVRRKRKEDGRGKSKKYAHIVTIDSKSPRTLRRLLLEDYVPQRMPMAKDASILKHLQAINKLRDFRGCEVTIDQLSDELVEQFLAWLVATGLQAISANSLRAALLAQWNYAWQRKLTDNRPGYIKKLRTPKRVPVAWTVEELNRILAAAAGMPGYVGDVPAGDWWPALLLTIYDTGLRIGAAMELRTQWLDLRGGFLTVPAEVQKQNADQAFQLAPDTLAAIERTNPARRGKLFEWAKDRHSLDQWYRVILQRAGLPHTPKDLFHKLRRTSASYIARYGGTLAATEHLGHSSARVTGHYLDPRISRQQQAVELLPRPAN